MLIKDLMKRPFVVDKDMDLAEAAKTMSDKKIGSLLFVSGNKIKGIISEGDLMKNFTRNSKISQIMEKKVITIGPDEPIDRALEIMRENKIKRLPVTVKNELVGIVTLTDIMANFEALEEEFFFD